ncbi:hypothetical protein EDC01DRAFT_628014 [Geopyxis carbonaria]|nr:hypothetical protein EDC01DRAFT_628014 [Geopyxis carbonaria]
MTNDSEDVGQAEMIDVDGEDSVQATESEELLIRVLPGEEPTSASFQIEDEDHTLGNSLRYMIMKNRSPYVEFCGYSIPHPSENKMNIRIQIYPEFEEVTRPVEVLMKGLDDLSDLCDEVRDSFTAKRDAFGKTDAPPS